MLDFNDEMLVEYRHTLSRDTLGIALRGKVTQSSELLKLGEFLDACDGKLISPAATLKKMVKTLALASIVPMLNLDLKAAHKAINASFALVAIHERAMRNLDTEYTQETVRDLASA